MDSVDILFKKIPGHGFHPTDIYPPTRQQIKELGLDLSVHAPVADLGTPEGLQLLEESVQFCADTGSKMVTIHPRTIANATVLRDIAKICSPYRSRILFSFENTGYAACLEELDRITRSFTDLIGIQCGVTFDIGHANLYPAGPISYLKQIKSPIIQLHIHDNHGSRDEHLPPGQGNINFARVFGALDEIGFSGRGILEYWDPDGFRGNIDLLQTPER